MANCGGITIQWARLSLSGTITDVQPSGEYNGSSFYQFTILGQQYHIWQLGSDWVVTIVLGDGSQILASYTITDYNTEWCPYGFTASWVLYGTWMSTFVTSREDHYDCCYNLTYWDKNEIGTTSLQLDSGNVAGTYNSYPYWQWLDGSGESWFYIYGIATPNGCKWIFSFSKGIIPKDDLIADTDEYYSLLTVPCGCPVSQYWDVINDVRVGYVGTAPCGLDCVPLQDRTEQFYQAVKLPIIFEEQDRGFKICCDCPMLVLAGGDTETWKNDLTSAWIKLSDVTDTITFILEKDGQTTSYTPPVYSFPNEDNAYYTTIPWRDVLASDGVGCYTLKLEYEISGLAGGFIWGLYKLEPYSIQNALKTARIRVKFNLRQKIEGINFTGANVEDCVRFYGFIGERQPNTEIDNLIYSDRRVKTVVRENLDQYTITTDPLLECFIRPLTDLWLLSENEMWISDYNAHNHSYRILDVPVTLEESPEIDYIDILQRRAKLTALVGLRTKDRRTFY